MRIDVSDNGGSAWHELAAGVEDTGGFLVDTRSLANGEHLLRVRAESDLGSSIAYAGPFAVRNPGVNAPRSSASSARLAGERFPGQSGFVGPAADLDDDALVVDVAYSLDRRITWRPVAKVSASEGGYLWDTPSVPNSHQVWLRLTVSDGRFDAETTSPHPFAVDNEYAPLVAFESPMGGELWSGTRDLIWRCDAGYQDICFGHPRAFDRWGIELELDRARPGPKRRLGMGFLKRPQSQQRRVPRIRHRWPAKCGGRDVASGSDRGQPHARHCARVCLLTSSLTPLRQMAAANGTESLFPQGDRMYSKITEAIVAELASIVGEANVVADSDRMEPYSHDETPELVGWPELVVKPGSTDEVAAVLRAGQRASVFR